MTEQRTTGRNGETRSWQNPRREAGIPPATESKLAAEPETNALKPATINGTGELPSQTIAKAASNEPRFDPWDAMIDRVAYMLP